MSRPLLFALFAGAACLAVSARAAPPPENAFAQAYSDVAPDPDILFGTLPNGFRYLIQRNATPAHQVALRLRIGSGSLEEADDQQGLAHYLEHMAFKGSTHVPEGDMIKLLERRGLAFGADTNASTGSTETVFMLDLPESDPESLGLGLMLMRETSSELTLSKSAMDAERGVILSEERLRDTPDFEAYKARLKFLLPGQLAPERLAIGQVDVIKNAVPERLRAYYAANYRPDRATLVVVGDVDPKAVEAEIRKRFADWRPDGPETREPALGIPKPRGSDVQLVIQPGAHDLLSLAWVRPFEADFESEAKDRRRLIEEIAAGVVRRRLDREARSAAPPFLGASVAAGDEFRSARVTTLVVLPKPDGWRPALAAAVAEARKAAAFGVSDAEIRQEITELRSRYETAAVGAATRRSPEIANELVRAIDEREVPTSPQQDLDRFNRTANTLKPGDVNAALAELFSGSGPLLSVTLHAPLAGGQAAVVDAFAQDEAAPLVREAAATSAPWPYEHFGAPGSVRSRTEVKDLGVSFVTFANGVRLNLKPTSFQKDEVLVRVRLGRGRLALPKDRRNEFWAHAALTFGGLRKISLEDMESALAGKIYGSNAGLTDDAFVLGGETRRSDLATQLQVLTAYVSDPAFRPEAFERVRNSFAAQLEQQNATPEGVFGREASRLTHGGDLRWAQPTEADVKAATLPVLISELKPFLDGASLEVDIVGDFDAETAVRDVAATFGALPQRAEPAPPEAAWVSEPPTGSPPVDLHHSGRKDQAIAYEAWPTDGLFADAQKTRAVNVAASVLQLRLIDEVRSREGQTYSPSVASFPSDVFANYGLVSASAEVPPDKIMGFYGTLSGLAADLRDKGPSQDEFDRALRPRLEGLMKAQQTNEYWLTWISGADVDPRRLEIVRDTLAGYRRLTPEDVRRGAAYFTDANAFRLEVTPLAAGAASGVARADR